MSEALTTPRTPLTSFTTSPSSAVDLRGRVALVTGAARGIGLAVCGALSEAGAAVAALDLVEPANTVHAIEARGGAARAVTGDVSSRAGVTSAIERTIDRLGRLDIVDNNAGVIERSSLEELDDTTSQREIDVILKGTYLVTQAAYDAFKRQGGGKIVNISSISGKLGGAVSRAEGAPIGRSGPAYASAKGGVIAFTKWVAPPIRNSNAGAVPTLKDQRSASFVRVASSTFRTLPRSSNS